MTLHTNEGKRSASEDGPNRSSARPHLRKPHRTRNALRTLRAELEALYDELTAALLPDAKGKK
jgi:hypothetical protein